MVASQCYVDGYYTSFANEIIRKLLNDRLGENDELYNFMRENQKDILNRYAKNILVVADTSLFQTWSLMRGYILKVELILMVGKKLLIK